MAVATGQFTIIDYNDAVTLTGIISSNRQKTQIYNPDNGSYTPDWGTSNLVLTPSLYKAGSATDIIGSTKNGSQKWYEVIAGNKTAIVSGTGNYTIAGASPYALTVAANKLVGSPNGVDYMFECIYTDATTGLDITYQTTITFSKVQSGGGIVDAIAWAPNGNVFKNETPATLLLECDMWRGSLVDTTNISYQWFQQDSTVWGTTLSAQANAAATSIVVVSATGITAGQTIKVGSETKIVGGAYTTGTTIPITTALAGTQTAGSVVSHQYYDSGAGAGWRKLSDQANVNTGTTTRQMTIYPASTLNIGAFKCQIKDTDAASPTYNQYFYDQVSVVDITDPYQVVITSTGGDVFKNGSGAATLTAKVFQNGVEIDAAGSTFTYTWTVTGNAGTAINFDVEGTNNTASKTGKSITITGSDVLVKSTFTVTLT